MKSDLLRQIRSAFTPQRVKFNKRIFIFLFFVLLSSFIWLLSKLDKEYFAQIKIPVAFENFPTNKIQIAPLPEKISVSVFGRGFSILRYKLLNFSTIKVDIGKQLIASDKADKEMFYFNTENILPVLDKEVYGELKMLSIEPKNIQFIFSPKSTKKVPVIPNISFTLDKNMLVDTVYIKPAFVMLSGPSFFVDTLDKLYTIPLHIGKISSDVKISSHIKPEPFCSYSSNNISVFVLLQQKTEKQLYVSTASLYKGDTTLVKFVPDKIKITFNVGVHDYNNVSLSMFQLKLDMNQNKVAHSSNYFIKLLSSPSIVSNIRISPSYVTIIKL